jgi:hypothetical protein
VARAAESIADIFNARDAEMLINAAWLHEIGYCTELDRVGFHPLDGARFLRDMQQVDKRLCRLVANHSCAVLEAGKRGLARELTGEFPPVRGLIADALTYCDMTTSPQGEPVDAQDRLSEILSRCGEGSIGAESIGQARPEIERSAQVVEAALAKRRGQKPAVSA